MQETPFVDAGPQSDATTSLSSGELAGIVDAIDDSVITHALDGEILAWNGGAQRMLGFTSGEAIGQRIDRLLREETREPRIDFVSALARNELPAPYEAVLRRQDGETVHVIVTIKPFHRASGAPVGWRNPGSGRHGSIVPGPIYVQRGLPCRGYTHTIFLDSRPQIARGTACKNPDGTWTAIS